MSVPESPEGWVEGIIPPARHWRVVYRYLGVADAVLHPDADACFAANAVCRRVYSRYPVDAAFHYRPLTKSDPRSLCADIDASGDAGPRSDDHPNAIPNSDPLRGDVAGRTGDGDGSSPADQLRAHDGDAGGDEGVFLERGLTHSVTAAGTATVRDARADDAVRQGGLT